MKRNMTQLANVVARTDAEDEFPNETIIRFRYKYHPDMKQSDDWYTYVAFKVSGSWFLTGRTTQAFTWDQLMAMFQDGRVKGVRISRATDWPKLEDLVAPAVNGAKPKPEPVGGCDLPFAHDCSDHF